MPHDAAKILLGTTPWSDKEITEFKSDPANFAPGLAVRETESGDLSTRKSDGRFVGVSLGQAPKIEGCTAVLRRGSQVPIRLSDGFSPTVGAQVWIDDETGEATLPNGGGTSSTATNANYVTGTLVGVDNLEDDGIPVALIDMVGGL